MKIIDNKIWREIFGVLMRNIFSFYSMNDSEFNIEIGCDASTAKHWKLGGRFTNSNNFELFSEYLIKKSQKCNTKIPSLLVVTMVATIMFLWTSSPQQMEYFTFIISIITLKIKRG